MGQLRMALRRILQQHIHRFVLQPLGPHVLEGVPRGRGAIDLAALHRQNHGGGVHIAVDGLEPQACGLGHHAREDGERRARARHRDCALAIAGLLDVCRAARAPGIGDVDRRDDAPDPLIFAGLVSCALGHLDDADGGADDAHRRAVLRGDVVDEIRGGDAARPRHGLDNHIGLARDITPDVPGHQTSEHIVDAAGARAHIDIDRLAREGISRHGRCCAKAEREQRNQWAP